MQRRSGFTLIELMIVVAIIAIIAAIAIPSLLRSRMNANEVAAVGACKAFAEAQEIYKRSDWDQDGVYEYSKNIGPNGGLGNGESLYHCVHTNTDIMLVDIGFANAEGVAGTAIPKAGYVFQLQTAQAWPIAKSFMPTGNNLTLGYGVSAVPASYDGTGRNSYQISNTGTIYQKDTGSSIHIANFTCNPATGWTVTE